MKSFNSYIFEKLKISSSTKALPSFENIQMFTQEEQFDINGLSLDYFKGVDSKNQTICYVECFDERFGDRFMLVIFDDDVYLQLVNEYNLDEIEDLGWNESPEELAKIVEDKLDTELPVFITGTGLWADTRFNCADLKRYERYIEKICRELHNI